MDAECSSVQVHNAGDRSMPDQPVHNMSQSTVRPLHELVTRSIAIETDTFQITWRDYQRYTSPPFGLVGKCLQKSHREESMVVLVAPVWETQSWYPYLLQLLIDYPLLLPVQPDLLSDPFKGKHPLLL